MASFTLPPHRVQAKLRIREWYPWMHTHVETPYTGHSHHVANLMWLHVANLMWLHVANPMWLHVANLMWLHVANLMWLQTVSLHKHAFPKLRKYLLRACTYVLLDVPPLIITCPQGALLDWHADLLDWHADLRAPRILGWGKRTAKNESNEIGGLRACYGSCLSPSTERSSSLAESDP